MDPYIHSAAMKPLSDKDMRDSFRNIVRLLRRDGKNSFGPDDEELFEYVEHQKVYAESTTTYFDRGTGEGSGVSRGTYYFVKKTVLVTKTQLARKLGFNLDILGKMDQY